MTELVWSSSGRSFKKAGTTERLLAILASHKDLRGLFGEAMGEQPGSSVGTTLTECREFGDLIGQWNTIQNLRKGLASPVSIETDYHNIASLLVHEMAHKLDQSIEELRLLNDHKLVRNIHGQLLKHSARVPHDAGDLELVVGHNTGIVRVALINVRLNHEHREIQRAVPTYHMVDLG